MLTNCHRSTVAATLATLAIAGMLGGCKSGASSTSAADTKPASSTEIPAANAALQPLAFMTGSWVAVNPNKTLNRETWMRPVGNAMTGMFVQMRRDSTPGFYEMTTIVAEPEGVTLYHRHVHRKLEIDERRKDVDVFKLVSAENGKAVFSPVKDQEGGLLSMTYRMEGDNVLVQEVAFKPGSKEKDFATRYTREAAR